MTRQQRIERAIIGSVEYEQKIRDEALNGPTLKPNDVQTTHDLDVYRWQNPLPNGHIDSRYNTLIRLVGRNRANCIMRNLEVASW